MAYGVKYRVEWQAAARDKNVYRIEILERDYEGEIFPLYPTGDVLTITQGSIDDDELVVLRGSEAKLSLLCVDEGEPYLSLFTTDPLKYQLKVSLQELGFLWHNMWEGYLSTSSYSQAYAPAPYKVTLSAVDGLAILKSIPFRDGEERYEGRKSLNEIITTIIRKISNKAVKFGAIDKVRPGQQENTMDVLALDCAAIYSSLGEDVTCYAVLEAILKSMRLTIFQNFNVWLVRTTASLVKETREVVNSLWNNGGCPIRLFSNVNDARGMSTSARLSLLSPYKNIKVSRPEVIDNKVVSKSMLDPARWKNLWDTMPIGKFAGDGFLRMRGSQSGASSSQYYGAYYIADSAVTLAGNVTIAISANTYSLLNEERTLNVCICLTDAPEEDIDALLGKDVELSDAYNWYSWNDEGQRWDKIGNSNRVNGYIEKSKTSIKLQPSKYQPFHIPCILERLTQTTVNVETGVLPFTIAWGKSARLVIILTGYQGYPLPTFEMREPGIALRQQDGVVEATFGDSIPVSEGGFGELTFEQPFADSWIDVGSGETFEAPLIDITTGGTMHGVVTPSQRPMLADVVAAETRLLRGEVMRQLEGEVNSGTMVDLDAIWVDRDGRSYYTNHISHKLRRGIDYVQLREMPSPSVSETLPKAMLKYAPDSVIGLDTSAYVTVSNSRSVYRFDKLTDTISAVLSSPSGTYPVSMNEGQRCVSLVTFDGVWYTLYAYDTYGKLLSKIEKVNSRGWFSQPYYESVFRSARFDANVNTWTMVGGDDTVTHIVMLDNVGTQVARSIISLSGYLHARDFVLLPNGFSYVSAPPATSLFTSYWHSNMQHPDLAFEKYAEYKRIVYANEMYLITQGYAVYNVYARTDTLVGVAEPSLCQFKDSFYRFVAANNALVVFQSIARDEIIVYDGRTGKQKSITSAVSRCTCVWLSEDSVYGFVQTGATEYRLAREVIKITTF